MPDNMTLLNPKARDGRRGYAPTLGWYLARNWLAFLGLTLMALGLFMALMNGLEALRMAAGKPTTAAEAAGMSLFKLPDMLLQLWPFAVLIATLVWLHGLNARTELVALRATGLPARRFLMAPLVACLLASVLALGVGNPVASAFLKRYQGWENQISPPDTRGVLTAGGSLWLRHDMQRSKNGTPMPSRTLFLYGAQVAAQGTQLISATAFVFDASNTLLLRLDADNARLVKGYWRMEGVTAWRPEQPPQLEEAVNIPTSLTPAGLAASLNPPPTLNVWELYKLVGVLKANGWPNAEHRLILANSLMLPLLAVAMLLLAVPFGLRTSRTRGIFVPIGLGLLLGFTFFALRNWVGAYAVAGRLEPALAAAVPVGVGLLLAFFLLVWLREE